LLHIITIVIIVTLMDKNYLKKAIKILGSQQALADAVGVSQPAVYKWTQQHNPIPLERAFQIERATRGAVTAKQLRPDFFDP